MTQPPSDGFRSPAGPRRVPPGWRLVRLGDVVSEALGGFASGERDPNGVAQLRMNNVTSRGSLDWSSVLRVPADSRTVERYKLQRGDVLFNNTNSTELVGKSALFTDHDEPVTFSNHFTRLRTIRGLLCPEYLVLWLRAQYQEGLFAAICNRWIGQSAVQRDRLLSLELPLPLLPEQQRIARLVTEQMTAVERARAAAEAQLEAAKALPSAHLRSVFDGPAAQAWPRRRVSTVCKSIDYGYTASADYGALGPRYLRITDIQDGKIEWVSVPGCDIAPEDEKAKVLADGDIVFARTGATTGKSILIRRPPRAVFASYLIRLRPTDDVTPEYLYAFFQSDGYWRQVRALARGGAQPNVNATLLGSIEVPVCPRSEQERLCTELASNEGIVGALRLAAERQLLSVDALPAAMLRRAFSGEL